MDQRNKQFQISARDTEDVQQIIVRPEDVKKISDTLQEWCNSNDSVLQTIENQIDRANSAKSMHTKHTEDLEAEVCVSTCLQTLFLLTKHPKKEFFIDVSHRIKC